MSDDNRLPDTCDYPREHLLAWRDGTLRGARREVTELHLATCSVCRAWLDAMDEVDRILRNASDTADDRPLRARIKQQASSLPPPAPAHPPGDLRRLALGVGVTTLVALLVAFVSLPDRLEGGSSFTRWLRPEPTAERAAGDTPGGTVLAVPDAIVPTAGLEQIGSTVVDTNGMTRSFRRADGLALSVTSTESTDSVVYLPEDPQPDSTQSQIVGVGGRDVLLLLDPEGRVAGASTGEVIGFAWADGEVRVIGLVIEQPVGGLTIDASIAIADQLIELDWSAASR